MAAKPKPNPQQGKTPLGPPDPLEAAIEAQRLAQEGNVKLARSIDAMRTALEIVATAEIDLKTGAEIEVRDLRRIALSALDEYQALTGVNWRLKRNKLSGPTRAGGTGNKPVREQAMPAVPQEY